MYSFTIEEGWGLTAETDRELFVFTEQDLVKGINPTTRVNPNQPTVARKRNTPPRESPYNPYK